LFELFLFLFRLKTSFFVFLYR